MGIPIFPCAQTSVVVVRIKYRQTPSFVTFSPAPCSFASSSAERHARRVI
jgi:hypothetical protein